MIKKPPHFKYDMGTRLRKKRGSEWQGKVVGFYCTILTPEGYCIESEKEKGSVQLYPEKALERVNDTSTVDTKNMIRDDCPYCNIDLPINDDADRKVFKWHLGGHKHG